MSELRTYCIERACVVEFVHCDLSAAEGRQACLRTVACSGSSLDLLVLCHNWSPLCEALAIQSEVLSSVLSIGFVSWVGLITDCMPLFRSSVRCAPRVIALNSGSAVTATPLIPMYAATKAALLNFFAHCNEQERRSVRRAAEEQRRHHRVLFQTALLPMVDTPAIHSFYAWEKIRQDSLRTSDVCAHVLASDSEVCFLATSIRVMAVLNAISPWLSESATRLYFLLRGVQEP